MTPWPVLLILLVALTPVRAASDGTEEVGSPVLSYLERLRDAGDGMAQPLQDTAISAFLGDSRREGIETRLMAMRRDWAERELRFEILGAKIDGDYGAVLVGAQSARDPLSVEVLGLGVQHRKDQWRSAPLPGGFEAVFLGFDEKVEKRVADLERWLSSERARLLRELRGKAAVKFRKTLSAAEPAAVRGEDPVAVVKAFMEACTARDLLPALACLGEMADEPSQAWMESKRVMVAGLGGEDARQQWRLVSDPLVLSVIGEAKEEGKRSRVRVFFFDPVKDGEVRALNFDLSRKDGRWALQLPPALRYADAREDRFFKLTRTGRDGDDLELFEGFRTALEKEYPPVAAATVGEAGERFAAAMRSPSPGELFSLLLRDEELTLQECRLMFQAASDVWLAGQSPEMKGHTELVGQEEREQAAVLVVGRLDTNSIKWIKLTPVHLLRRNDRWAIAPGVEKPGNFGALPEEQVKAQRAVQKAYERKAAEYRALALSALVGTVGSPLDLSLAAPDKAAAVALVKEFRRLLVEDRALKSLSLCALVDAEKGIWNALRATTYAARGAKMAPDPDDYFLVASAGPWVAVSLRISAPDQGTPHYLMYLVAPSVDGPRVLADVDLRLATNKGRTILNEEILADLGRVLDPGNLQLVKDLFRGHTEKAQALYEEWEKNTR